MNIAILASPSSWYVADLLRAGGSRHRIVPLAFSTLSSLDDAILASSSDGRRHALSTFDVVLVRSMPPASLEQIVYRMDVLQQLHLSGTPVINPPRALEAAIDKYLALARLKRHGFLTPRTWVGQRWQDAMECFESFGRDVVAKPLFGSEGRGLMRVTDVDLAWRTFKTLERQQAIIYLQEFLPHGGFDLRLLQIGDDTIAIQRHHPTDWRTNISQGGRAVAVTVTKEMADQAREISQVIGAPLLGIDLLPAKDGKQYLLEVNAVPGWRAMGKALQQDVASKVLTYVERTVNRQRPELGRS